MLAKLISSVPYFLWLVFSALFIALGDFSSKLWADNPKTSLLILTVILYLGSSLLWLPALLKRNELAILGTAWSLLTILGTVLIGVLFFDEELSSKNWLGVALACISVYFVMSK